ncbi:MAG: SDR family NAD(P)-dependent oxidoreductase [Thermoanaerobaculia bacterium]
MKLALITGASSGIGADAARHLARAGARVVLVARDAEALARVAAGIGDAAVVESCDVSIGGEVHRLAERVRRDHGVPDVVVNSAGAGAWKRIEDTTPEEAAGMMAAPYLAAFNVTRAFLPDMLSRRSGVVIHVNSPAAFFPWPSSVGYASARFALRGFHEALCQDLAGSGVRSCHVVFGKVDSPYFDRNPGAVANMPAVARTIRTLTTDECGRVIAKLAFAPRRELIHPFLLRLYVWSHRLTPGLVRLLLRAGRPGGAAGM